MFPLGASFKEVGSAFTVSFQVYLCHSYLHNVHISGAGKNGSTVAGTSVLSPVVPLFLMIAPAVLVAWKSTEGIYISNPCLYLLTFGFVAARVTNRLVVAHMTKSEMAYSDSSMFGPAILFLNQYFNTILPESFLLWVVLIYVTYDLIKYCQGVCLDICDHLNIRLFIIQPSSLHHHHSTSPPPANKPFQTGGGEKNGNGFSSITKYNTRNRAKNRLMS